MRNQFREAKRMPPGKPRRSVTMATKCGFQRATRRAREAEGTAVTDNSYPKSTSFRGGRLLVL
jgi:hypothetical protein